MTLRQVPLTVPEQIADIYEQLRRRKPMSGDPPETNLLVEVDGIAIGTAQILNLLQGSGIILGGTSSDGQVNITFSSSGGTNDHDHMGTGTDSTIVSGLLDSTAADASGLQSTAGGTGSIASGDYALALGDGAEADAPYGTAVGHNSYVDAVATSGVALGNQAQARGPFSTALGTAAQAFGDGSVAIANSQAVGDGSIAINQADANNDYSIAIGKASEVLAVGGVALGAHATTGPLVEVNANYAVSIAALSVAHDAYDVAIGYDSNTAGQGTSGAVGIGKVANAVGIGAVALGSGTSVAHNHSAALGEGAITTANNQIMMGTSAETVYLPGAFKMPTGASSGYVLTSDAAGVGTWQAGGGGGGVTGFATPNLTLGTANAAGAATTVIRSDATILAFDSTNPVTQAFGDTASPGSGTIAAYRNHKHAMPTAAVTTSGLTQATAKMLGRSTAGTGAIEEITVGSGLSLSAGSLIATGGTTSPLTTKGDIWAYTTADARFAVGANGTMIEADSSQSIGLAWVLQSYANVYRNAAQNLANGAFTQVNYDTVDTQSSDNPFDATTNHNFTCKRAGRYLVTGAVQIAGTLLSGLLTVSVFKNGTEYRRGIGVQTATWNAFPFDFQVKAALNDTLDVRVFQSQAAAALIALNVGLFCHAGFSYLGA